MYLFLPSYFYNQFDRWEMFKTYCSGSFRRKFRTKNNFMTTSCRNNLNEMITQEGAGQEIKQQVVWFYELLTMEN